MAAKYLLTCPCGAEHAVSAHQAGSRIACACGKQVNVPQLRKLAEFPRQVDTPQVSRREWGLRQSFATAGGAATLILLMAALWMWQTEPEVPQFLPQRYLESVDEQLEQATPRQLWQRWAYDYQSLPHHGFQEFPFVERDYIEAIAKQRRLYRNVCLALAATVAALTAIAYFSVRPTARR